jgi:hypothetical protein
MFNASNVLILNDLEFHKEKINNQIYCYVNFRFPFLFMKYSKVSLSELKLYNSTLKKKKYNSQHLVLLIDLLGDYCFTFIETGIFKVDSVNLLVLLLPKSY